MKLIDPFPGLYDASDPFGSLAGGRTYPHTGSDWFASAGKAAPAIGAGVIVNKQWHSGNGNTVTVQLPDGHYYAYLHLQSEAVVSVGQTVAIGTTLGYVGDTGTNSRGAHLHITVSDSPQAYVGLGNKIDPWAFIQAHINDTDPVTPPEEEEDYMLVYITKDASSPWFKYDGWYRTAIDGTEAQRLVDLGLVKSNSVKVLGPVIESIPLHP